MIDLTIGTAVYDDLSGLEWTLHALRLSQDLDGCEILVIDNHPGSEQGQQTRRLVEQAHGRPAPARYVPMPEPVGTSAPRDRVFAEAAGRGVLCCDSHVLLAPGAVARLRRLYRDEPDTIDIHSGPMLNGALEPYATHFSPYWRAEMWGVWGQAWRCPCGGWDFDGFPVEPRYADGVQIVGSALPPVCQFHSLSMDWEVVAACPRCGRPLPEGLAWVQHEPHLAALGYTRLGWDPEGPTFEVPGNGLGLFSARKDAWPGFHPEARGFGGEELYIHAKFRRSWGRALCHPWLRWWHRFGRPGGVPYPLTLWNKLRNYVLEFVEMGWDLAPVHDHFVATGKITEKHWEHLVADPVGHATWPGDLAAVTAPAAAASGLPQPPAGATLDDVFRWAAATKRDADEHLPKIRELAAQCRHVTAMTKRREWDAALLAGGPQVLVSHVTEADPLTATLAALAQAGGRTAYRVDAADSMSLETIEPTDMLLIDTLHDAVRLREELRRFASAVGRWIVLRGTAAFGETREGGNGPGLMVAAREFMAQNFEWKRVYQADIQYGLTVLSRDPAERTIDRGPGTELHAILESLGISATASCSCRSRSRQMDQWGVSGCREHRDEIVAWMREGQDKFGWKNKLTAAAKAVTTGLAFRIQWTDPFPGIIDEAIRRAEAKDLAWEDAQRRRKPPCTCVHCRNSWECGTLPEACPFCGKDPR